MATVSKGYVFSPTEQVTDAKLHTMVDGASVTNIVNADIASGAAIGEAKINLDGSQIVDLTSTQTISGDKIFSGNIYTDDWADYSATSTIVGWGSFTTKQIYVKKIGKTVFCSFRLIGVSDSATTTFTLPYAASGTSAYGCFYSVDSGTPVAGGGMAELLDTSSTVSLYKDMVGNAYTNSGNKTCSGQFWYESA